MTQQSGAYIPESIATASSPGNTKVPSTAGTALAH